MLSCKEVVKRVSQEESGTWRRSLKVKFHLLFCTHCRKYTKQLEIIKTAYKDLFNEKLNKVDTTSLHELENRVIKRLQK